MTRTSRPPKLPNQRLAVSEAKIVALYVDHDVTQASIARRYGLTVSSIVAILRRHGVEPKHGKRGPL